MNVKFNERLKELRVEKNYSQKSIAIELGISTTCYAGYEQGYRQPDLKMLTKICVLLETSADYLLGLSDEF
ncbi:MAG: helix-turn-helix transcriptional regulator [Clostridia bacterium]|nr:helix-turn-helix transcriptional regulator [Clostridia bacterium]